MRTRGLLVLFVICFVLGMATAALADRTFTASAAKAALTHGDWQRKPDGTFQLTVCGATTDVKTSKPVPLERPCVPCSAPTWARAEAACASAWRKANGL